MDDKGKISKDSYSRENNKKLEDEDSKGNDEKPDKNGKGNKGKEEKDEKNEKNEDCLTKMLKAPFQLLWWLTRSILKNALVILTFGIVNSWFDKD